MLYNLTSNIFFIFPYSLSSASVYIQCKISKIGSVRWLLFIILYFIASSVLSKQNVVESKLNTFINNVYTLIVTLFYIRDLWIFEIEILKLLFKEIKTHQWFHFKQESLIFSHLEFNFLINANIHKLEFHWDQLISVKISQFCKKWVSKFS